MDRITETIYFPATDGQPPQPAPFVLTEEDAMRLLRIEGSKDAYAVLRRYREKGLKATQVGRHVRYLLPNVVRFLEKISN